jgi:hypothetical protein
MSNNYVCYVTLFYDINRSTWKNKFKRTFEQYLISFEPFIPLFNKKTCENNLLVIFIDKKWENELINKIDSYKNNDDTFNIKIIPIDDKFMNLFPIWQTINREREIMNSNEFKNTVGSRIIYPEHKYPEYTLINHCKIDAICYLIDSKELSYEYYCWVDFGFFNLKTNIPEKLLDVNLFNLETINYTLLNEITEKDKDIYYTLQYAPEKIGGYFFLGRKDKLKEYQILYHKILDYFQNVLNIADDDQHLSLQCYFKNPSLFTLHYTGVWHNVLVKYQQVKNYNYVYVTLLFPNKFGKCDYLDGAILTGLGLKYQNVKYKLICMVTPDVSFEVINILKKIYCEVIVVNYISPLDTGIKINKTLFSPDIFKNTTEYSDLCKVFTKLHIFNKNLLPYDKVLFIDSDLVPLKNYDTLFELNTPAGWLEKILEDTNRYERIWGIYSDIPHGSSIPNILTDIYKKPGRSINGGLLLIKPNNEIFLDMIKNLQQDSSLWIGESHKFKGSLDLHGNKVNYFTFPEQDYLTQYFSGKWTMIDGKYASWGTIQENDFKNTRGYWSMNSDSIKNNNNEEEVYGVHMANMLYHVNNVSKPAKTWIFQQSGDDVFNYIPNKITYWGLLKYPFLKNILMRETLFSVKNGFIKIENIKINDNNYNNLSKLQKNIINLLNISQ